MPDIYGIMPKNGLYRHYIFRCAVDMRLLLG